MFRFILHVNKGTGRIYKMNDLLAHIGGDKAHRLEGRSLRSYVEPVSVPDNCSVDGVDAFSCLILAAAALALFPRKRFRISSL